MASGPFRSNALHGAYGGGAGPKGASSSMKPSFEDIDQ